MLNNDTELAPDCLEQLARAARQWPEAGFFAARLVNFHERHLLDGAGILKKMNRPIKFFGLTSLQFDLYLLFTMILIVVLVATQINSLLMVAIVALQITLSGFLFRQLVVEHKKGNPDYLTSVSIKSATPSKIVDKNKVFKLIYKS